MSETKYEFDAEPTLYRVIRYSDFEALVAKHFNNPDYSLVANQELSNDSVYEGDTNFVPSTYDIDRMEKFMRGEWVDFMPVDYLLAELAVKGVIPPGQYLIRISW